MRGLFLIWLVAASASAAQAQTIQRIEIIDAGIYTAQADETINIRLVQRTTTIVARLGVSFGFRYRVKARGSKAVKLEAIALIPPPGIRNPRTGYRIEEDVKSMILKTEEINFTGYTFSAEWEIVPGTWTFELWDGERKLATQSFDVFQVT